MAFMAIDANYAWELFNIVTLMKI